MFELIVLLALIAYFYHDYKKAKQEGMTLDDYIKSWVRGIAISVFIIILLRILLGD